MGWDLNRTAGPSVLRIVDFPGSEKSTFRDMMVCPSVAGMVDRRVTATFSGRSIGGDSSECSPKGAKRIKLQPLTLLVEAGMRVFLSSGPSLA